MNNYNTKDNFIDIPARILKFLLRKLKIFDLFEKHVKDARLRQGKYSVACLLMVALLILICRSASKNQFYQNKKLGRGYQYKNVGAFCGIQEGLFPDCKTIDDAFLSLDPQEIEPILFDIFKQLLSSKLFYNHPSLKKNGTFHIGIDVCSTHTYYPHSQHPCDACPFCLKRERKSKDGKKTVWYMHMEAVACLIFEGGFQIPLFLHRIRKRKQWEGLSEDGLKQECEITAFPIILEKIRHYLPKLKIETLLDALYANDPCIHTLEKNKFAFCIVLKKLKSVQEAVDPITKKVRYLSSRRFCITQEASFTNDIPYQNRLLNVIEFDEHTEKKLGKRFSKLKDRDVHWQWLISKKLDDKSLFSQAEGARLRWHEEDLFNSLKNRGYNFKHDYSRRPMSQTIWHLLTLIAFAITSIFEICDLGITARKGATLQALMKQILQDLFYLPFEAIFLCHYPKQLRFSIFSCAP